MAKYQKYAEYQDAGVEWLKEIPKNWFIGDLRRGIDFLTDFEANGSFADVKANVKLDSEEKFAWYVRATDLQNQRFEIVEGNRTVDSKAYSFLNKTALYGGELLVAKRGEIGKVYLMPEISCRATLAPNLYLIRLNNLLYPKYTFYWFLSLYGKPQLELADKSTTIGALYKDDVKACRMLYPSYVEQTNIGNFLDHETAKIDSLIEKQQQLIQLLKEKRQAVISHAVTKGLDPHVKMKDSGVEWLGEVPEHWEVIYIKHITEVKRGASPRPIDDSRYFSEDGEYSWTRIADVSKAGMYLTETTQRLSNLGSSLSVRLNSDELFLSIAGTVGKPCITVDKACIHDGFVYFPTLKINNKFLYYIFEAGQAYLGLGKMGTQLNLNTDTVGGIKIGLPSNNEIEELIAYIEKQKNKYDLLLETANKQIDLLKERRIALISAAVTGKIDVRNWQNPTEAKMEFSA